MSELGALPAEIANRSRKASSRPTRRSIMTKPVVLCVALCLSASSAFAELRKDDVKRLNESAAVLSELRSAPDKSIPEDLWNKAQCVLVFPSVKKAAFIVGGEFGAGVLSCRQEAIAGSKGVRAARWSPPVF